MAETMGSVSFAPPNPEYWRQQQTWGGQGQGQMGTRGVEGSQGQPLSPGEFGPSAQAGGFQGQQPGEFQGQMGQQQGFGMPQPGGIAPHEKAVLRGVLDILKEGRTALATGAVDGLVAQRLTAAHAYLCGFLESKGQAELGAYIKTIPPLSTRGVAPRYDEMVNDLEMALSEGAETRFGWGSIRKAFKKVVDVAPDVWSGVKTGYNMYQQFAR